MSKHEFKTGDLIMFAYPEANALDDTIRETEWEAARLGLVIDVIMARPNDIRYGDELLVLHDGERWSVPSLWCRATKVGL